MDDGDGSIRVDHPQFEVYSQEDRRRRLGANEIAIPKKNGACRDFGFYLAWKEGKPDEIVVALDDDCVVGEDFAPGVERALGPGARPVARGDGRFWNVFELYEGVDTGRTFPRGFPYSARVDYAPWRLEPGPPGPVSFNLGLWRGAFDIGAVDKFGLERSVFPNATLRHENALVPHGALVSVCAGNMHFRRELVPAVYQLPMNVPITGSWSIDRHGDIWGGFVLKTLMDLRGDRMGVGAPLVDHAREAPFEANVPKEHLAHLVSDELVALLEEASGPIRPGPYLEMARHLYEELRRRAPAASPVLRHYLAHLDTCATAWLDALA